jgi:hypothetical protein
VSRVSATALIVAVLSVVAYATPAAAANNSIVLAYFGDCQFLGAQAGSGKTVKIEWRDADGSLKSKHSVTSTSAGNFLSRCEPNEEIERGDTIKTTIGTSSRTLTIPRLTARFNRSTSELTGWTDPGLNFTVTTYYYYGGFDLYAVETAYVSAQYDGFYDLGYDESLVGGNDWGEVNWQSLRGDMVVRTFNVPGMTIWLRKAIVNVVGGAGTNVGITLKSGDDVISQTGGNLWEANNAFFFFDGDGERVKTQVGNEVIADFAPDAHFVLPNITATINKSNDSVAASCGLDPGAGVLVRVHPRDNSKLGQRFGTTNSSGVYLANFAKSPAYNIVAGNKVEVYCKVASGDIVARMFTAQ